VIWYGDLPEEISFIFHRQHEKPWATLSYAMIVASLLLPFCILLSQAVKKKPGTLGAIGLLILAGMWLERYLLVVPSVWPAPATSVSRGTGACGEPSRTIPAVVAAPTLPVFSAFGPCTDSSEHLPCPVWCRALR
jgi:hypothetical protein